MVPKKFMAQRQLMYQVTGLKFPRYGFLSAYGQLSNSYMDSIINNLNRLHINGLQFYDWDYDHQQPLAGTVANPASNWLDIASRTNYKSTVDYYISAAHYHNMKAMSYNLCYGALNDAAQDGVSDEWYMYKDQRHAEKVFLNLSAPFKSNIYLTNPGNTSWQQYLASKTQDMYDVYAFDGFHVDQVGDLGVHYDYNGNQIDVPKGFASFLSANENCSASKTFGDEFSKPVWTARKHCNYRPLILPIQKFGHRMKVIKIWRTLFKIILRGAIIQKQQ